MPDPANWTWVLDHPDGGAATAGPTPEEVPALLRSNAAGFRNALKRGGLVDERPPVPPGSPVQLSALEYAAHIRDVYARAAERITRMMKKKSPTFADWDLDTGVTEDHRDEDPDRVAYALAVNAGKVADLLDKVRGDQWQRTAARPDGASFTLAAFALATYHQVTEHLTVVDQGFGAILEARKLQRKG